MEVSHFKQWLLLVIRYSVSESSAVKATNSPRTN